MDFKTIMGDFNKELYISRFQEAKRQFFNSFKIKINKKITLQEILNLQGKTLRVGQKVKSGSLFVYIKEISDHKISIIYKIKDNFYIKTAEMKKNYFLYSQLIKMKKSPWGIERQYMKLMLKKEFKKTIKKILNVIND